MSESQKQGNWNQQRGKKKGGKTTLWGNKRRNSERKDRRAQMLQQKGVDRWGKGE